MTAFTAYIGTCSDRGGEKISTEGVIIEGKFSKAEIMKVLQMGAVLHDLRTLIEVGAPEELIQEVNCAVRMASISKKEANEMVSPEQCELDFYKVCKTRKEAEGLLDAEREKTIKKESPEPKCTCHEAKGEAGEEKVETNEQKRASLEEIGETLVSLIIRAINK